MNERLKAVSLFSGCGGFDLGVSRAGVDIIWANDNDPHAVPYYRELLPSVEFCEKDVTQIKSFPDGDILLGCYPCTGFSLGARRRWRGQDDRDLKNDDGNFLYEDFLRALDQVNPKYFFVENVRGMKSAEDGWFFDKQLDGFRRREYTVKHKLLYAEKYGVPQARRRIFIVGVRDDINLDYQFPKPTHGPEAPNDYVTMEDAIGDMALWPEGEYFDYQFHGHYLTRNRKRGWDELSYTIVANAHHVTLHPMGDPMEKVGEDDWELRGDKNRRLSWRECAVLQGLPRDIEPSGNIRDKHRVIGNAVPPQVSEELVSQVVEFENSLGS
jgi:DNA (cytosine-5)-methyltransferase 1